MTNLIDITNFSDVELDSLLGVESESSEDLTTSTVDSSVLATGEDAIGTCIVEALRVGGFSRAKVSARAVELTHFDCEYVVEQIEAAHGRKPTPAECDALNLSSRYALTWFDIEELNG